MKNFVDILKGLLMGLLFPLMFFAAFTLLTSKSDLLGVKSFVVLTGSMEPTLPVGSVIYTIPQSTYSPGDIVAFKSSTLTVTHRIVATKSLDNGITSTLLTPTSSIKSNSKSDSFITKGDANKKPDQENLKASNIKGKVFLHFPYIGRLVNALRTPLGFLFAIVLPCFVFIGVELWNIKTELELNTEKRVLKRIAELKGVNHYE